MRRTLTFFLAATAWAATSYAAQSASLPESTAALVSRLQNSGRYIAVHVLWQRQPGGGGPESVVEGEWGGSAGLVDLYAPYGSSRQPRLLTLSKADNISIHTTHRGPEFDAPFVVGDFNDAPDASASIVPLPVVWADNDFQLDLSTLLSRTFGPQDLRFRRIATYYELNGWSNSLDRPPVVYPAPPNALGGTPVTAQALMDLMLTGHASEASRILHESWPSIATRTDIKAGGEQGTGMI